MKRALLLVLALLATQCHATTGPEESFWSWFQQHEAAYYALDPDDMPRREALFDALDVELAKVHSDLTFEFGPVIEGRRDFVVSAAGIKSAFPAVRNLVSKAPALTRWTVIAFRPRRSPVSTIQFQDVSLDPQKVLVRLSRDGDKVGMTIFIDQYSKAREAEFGQAAFLLLDEALGEFDVETKVGFIELRALPETIPPNTVPLSGLASAFDRLSGP
jgi:hypothetical protein